MNELQKLFDFRGQQLRVIEQNNESWFVAGDVCKILDHSQISKAVERLDDDEKLLGTLFLSGQNRQTWLFNESGLYELILTSRKSEAKTFKKWVKQEVLPSIRKHGAYMTENTLEKALTSPDFLIQLATQLKEEQTKRFVAEQKIQKQQPLVSFAESCMASDKSLLVRELAKLVSKQGILIGERRLYQKLRDWRLIFLAKNEPYQEYIDRGYFEVSQGVKENVKGSFTWLTMRITPKGQAYIINRLKKEQQDVAI
jgi:anti-repressor protein